MTGKSLLLLLELGENPLLKQIGTCQTTNPTELELTGLFFLIINNPISSSYEKQHRAKTSHRLEKETSFNDVKKKEIT